MSTLVGSDYTNPTGGEGNPLTLPPSGNYGCAGECQNGGYRFKRVKSRRSKTSRCARGTKKRTRGCKKKTRGRKKNKRTMGRKKTRGRKKTPGRRGRGGYHYGKKHRGHSKKMRGGMHALTPGSVGENISLTTSMAANNVPSSFGFSLGGDQNTMSGALANPPPHARYQRCPNA